MDGRGGNPASLLRLFLVFLKVGALGFGGPYALLALMEREVVEKRGWLSTEQFAQSTAMGTLTPGPIFFAAAVHVGYQMRGLCGATVTAVASLLPGFLAAVAFAVLYLRVESLPVVRGAARGLSAAIVGLLVAVALRTGRTQAREAGGALLAVLSFVALEFLRCSPVLVIVFAGTAGLLIYGRPSRENGVRSAGEREEG